MKHSFKLFIGYILCTFYWGCEFEEPPLYLPVNPPPPQGYQPPAPFPKFCDSLWGRELIIRDLTWVADSGEWGNNAVFIATPAGQNIFNPCNFLSVLVKPDSLTLEQTAENKYVCCQPYEYFYYSVQGNPARLFVFSNHLNYQWVGKKATLRIKY